MCPNFNTAPIRCAIGYYQTSTQQTSCIQCPEGSSCSNPNVAPVTCPANHYSGFGAVECLPCPAGKQCSAKTASAISDCPANQYSLAGVASCTACAAGSYCPNRESQQKCPEGYYSAVDAQTCTACEVGSYCTGGVKTTCPHLTYADNTGSIHCREVPTNYIISSFVGDATNITGGSAVTQCGENQYTDDMHWTCTTCDDAHLCTSTQDVIPCPYGHAKLNGNWYCSPCPPGSICVISSTIGATVTETINSYVTALPTADHSYPRSSAFMELGPKICPPNNYCSEDGLHYHICPHGTYPFHGGCTDCSEDKFCLTSFKREITCTSGSISSLRDSFPRSVPQGYLWGGYSTGFTVNPSFKSTVSALGRILLTTDSSLLS